MKKYICAKCKKEIIANNIPFQWRKMWYFSPTYISQNEDFKNPFLCPDCFDDWTKNYYNKYLRGTNTNEQWRKGFEEWLGRKWTPFPSWRAWRIA